MRGLYSLIKGWFQAIGRSHGGLHIKIHALLETNGLSVGVTLTEGKAHDSGIAADMLDDISQGRILLADRCDGAGTLRKVLAE